MLTHKRTRQRNLEKPQTEFWINSPANSNELHNSFNQYSLTSSKDKLFILSQTPTFKRIFSASFTQNKTQRDINNSRPILSIDLQKEKDVAYLPDNIQELKRNIFSARDDVIDSIRIAYDGLKLEHSELQTISNDMSYKLDLLKKENNELRQCLSDLLEATKNISVRHQMLVVSSASLMFFIGCIAFVRIKGAIMVSSPWPEIAMIVSLLFFWIAYFLPKSVK